MNGAVLNADLDFWHREPALLTSVLDIARSALQEWEHLPNGPKSLTGFRYVKRSLAGLERASCEP